MSQVASLHVPGTEPSPFDREAFFRENAEALLSLLSKGFRFRRADGDTGFHRVPDPFDAEELAQEAFAQFFLRLEKGDFDRTRPPLPYLRRIAINLALRRAGQRAREVPLDVTAEPSVRPHGEEVEAKELSKLVETFRQSLTGRDRQVWEAFTRGEAPSQSAVGDRLGLSRDQVYRSLARIRSRATHFFGARGWP